jgi:DNA-binding CsgD family transcriptional regulator
VARRDRLRRTGDFRALARIERDWISRGHSPGDALSRPGEGAADTSDIGSISSRLNSIEEARSAWGDGDFERCVGLCASARPTSDEARKVLALLSARALLRLDRAADALRQLHAIGEENDVSVRMLIAAAQARNGEHDEGLRTLRALLTDPATDHATCAETNLWIALACYGKRDLNEADAALDAVPADGGMVHVRAMEYRGWVASARTDYDRAVASFSGTLQILDACPERDAFVEANCVQAISSFAVERFDRMAWSTVLGRRARSDWSASGLNYLQFLIALRAAAFAYDVEGDAVTAASEACRAEVLAPSIAYRVQALCSRAWISRFAGEKLAQREHVRAALLLFDGIGAWAPEGDECIVALVLAEELGNAGHAKDARRVFDVYRNQAASSPMLAITSDRRRDGYEMLVEAQILEAEGKVEDAVLRYREAFQIFCPLGYVRRSIVAAVRLIQLSPRDEYLWGHIDLVVARLSKGSWIGPVADQLRRARRIAALTAVQREHLPLICAGMSNPDIARLRKRSKHTVRNQIATLFEAFGVHTRAELVVECVRLGLLSSEAAV